MFTNDTQHLVAHKVMILYAIRSNGGQFSKSELTDFFMSYDYMNFFEFQQYLTELLESTQLELRDGKDGQIIIISESGLTALAFFTDRIEKSLRREIDLRVEIGKAKAVIRRRPEGRYLVQDDQDYAELMIREDHALSFYLKLLVPDRQSAEILISRWYDDFEVMAKELKQWYQALITP